jgi:hypothetical protein
MVKHVRRPLIGLAVVLVSLTGLLTVSALVPEVGCQRQEDINHSFFMTPTDIYISVPTYVNVGQTFTINGTLEKYNIPFPDLFPQQIVTIKSELFHKKVLTDTMGQFSIQAVVQKPGHYYIEAFYAGDQQGFYIPSTARKDLEVIGEVPVLKPTNSSNLQYYLIIFFIVVAITIYLIDRRFNFFNRKIKINNKPAMICFLIILILIVAGAMAFTLTARKPTFDYGYFNKYLSENFTRPNNIDYSLHYIPTNTILKIPEKVEPGRSLEFHGIIWQYSVIVTPLPQISVDIFISPIHDTEDNYALSKRVVSVITDNEGNFSGKIDFKQAGEYEVSAVFNDTGSTYIGSNDVKVVRVGNIVESPFDDWKSPGWLSIIIGMPILFLILLTGFIFFRHRWKTSGRDQKVKVDNNNIISPSPPPTPTPVHTHGSQVSIEFPQISSVLPDVWGKDESLLIMFTVEGSKQILENYSLDIEFGADSTIRSPINQEGRAAQEHVFRKKGQYQIQAVLVKDVRNGYIPASRIVRIVDYREEIVRLYNEMVGSVKGQGLTLSSKMTVREVENRLRKAFPDLSSEITSSLISVFEEANYSLHPVSRPEYEKMYRAVGEVNEQIMGKK